MMPFRRLTLRAILSLVAVSILALAILARFCVAWYLRSDRFQKQISAAVSSTLHADGAFMPLHFTDGTFYTDGFVAHGERAFFSDLRADQIRAILNWRGLWHRRWQIDELTIQQLNVRFVNRSAMPSPPVEQASPLARPGTASHGWKIDLRKASIAQSSWQWGANDATAGRITGSSFILTPSGDSWIIDASGGRITQPNWPELTLDSARLRYTSSALFITESNLRNGPGRIGVIGEIDFREKADLQAQLTDLPLPPLLAPDWRARLSGKLSGTAKIHVPLPDGQIHVEGNLSLNDGQVEALPILDQIATFTRTERFRRLALSKASFTFTRDGEMTSGKNVVVESEGLIRIEGGFTVTNGQIDGLFQIGVTASSLQWLPGSQERVFTTAHDGYFWTPLHVTGPVAHPKEDLTPRLTAAAANELLQKSQDTLIDTAKSILDLVPH